MMECIMNDKTRRKENGIKFAANCLAGVGDR